MEVLLLDPSSLKSYLLCHLLQSNHICCYNISPCNNPDRHSLVAIYAEWPWLEARYHVPQVWQGRMYRLSKPLTNNEP